MIDPITIEVIGSALSSIVEEMGEALIRASYSTNIKERRDCSTALFDLEGKTLCQAEHIPMHLGSFLDLIPHIIKRHPLDEMRPGDVFALVQPIDDDRVVAGTGTVPAVGGGGELVEIALLHVRAGKLADVGTYSIKQAEILDDEIVSAFVSQHYGIRLRPDCRYINRLAECNVQSFPLPDGIERISLMLPKDIPLLVYKIAPLDPLFQPIHPAFEKSPVIIVRYKADLIAFTLFSQFGIAVIQRHLPDLRLAVRPQR